jgi:hypothetical protein
MLVGRVAMSASVDKENWNGQAAQGQSNARGVSIHLQAGWRRLVCNHASGRDGGILDGGTEGGVNMRQGRLT